MTAIRFRTSTALQEYTRFSWAIPALFSKFPSFHASKWPYCSLSCSQYTLLLQLLGMPRNENHFGHWVAYALHCHLSDDSLQAKNIYPRRPHKTYTNTVNELHQPFKQAAMYHSYIHNIHVSIVSVLKGHGEIVCHFDVQFHYSFCALDTFTLLYANKHSLNEPAQQHHPPHLHLSAFHSKRTENNW